MKTSNKLKTYSIYHKLKECLKKDFKEENTIKSSTYYSLLMDCPTFPRLYVMPKLHKTPICLRPIVNTVNCATYKISDFLKCILKNIFIKYIVIKRD